MKRNGVLLNIVDALFVLLGTVLMIATLPSFLGDIPDSCSNK